MNRNVIIIIIINKNNNKNNNNITSINTQTVFEVSDTFIK